MFRFYECHIISDPIESTMFGKYLVCSTMCPTAIERKIEMERERAITESDTNL